MDNRLKEIIISVTNRCNLRCAMCQISDKESANEMSTAELKAVITDAVAFCPRSIVFSGGEPLLRKDIFELIAFARQHKFNNCLTSNGTLINDGVAAQLAASGMDVVNISIEGPEDVHDALRGKGNYKKALLALDHLARYKIETTIATVVCRQNYKFMRDVFELARQKGVTTVKFQPFSDIFLIDKTKGKDFFIPADFKKDFEDIVEDVIRLSEAAKIATNPNPYLRSLPAYLCGQWRKVSPVSCAALWASCPISAGGDVHPCWVFASKVLGNVKKTRFSNIWNSKKHDKVRQQVLEKECTGCFMSCYDANLGKQGLGELLLLKAEKFKKPKFYKRMYFRSYQHARYVSGKIWRRIIDSRFFRTKKPLEDGVMTVEAIHKARDKMAKKLKTI